MGTRQIECVGQDHTYWRNLEVENHVCQANLAKQCMSRNLCKTMCSGRTVRVEENCVYYAKPCMQARGTMPYKTLCARRMMHVGLTMLVKRTVPCKIVLARGTMLWETMRPGQNV